MSRGSRMGVGVSGAASAGDCVGGMALAGDCVRGMASAGKGGVASDGESFAARVGRWSRVSRVEELASAGRRRPEICFLDRRFLDGKIH